MTTLHLILSQEPAALERVMRLVRHRGFTLLDAALHRDDKHQHLALGLGQDRPLSLLTTQLGKLPDVLSLSEENDDERR